MKLTKKLVQTILYVVLVFLLILLIIDTMRRRAKTVKRKKIPVIHDVHIVNLDKSKDRWSKLQAQLKKLKPLPCIRWSATDGRTLSEEQMLELGIPGSMLPSSPNVPTDLKERRRGEIGCYLSHKRLLEHLATLDVDPDAGHLILEDDVIIDDDFLSTWNEKAQHLPKKWGLFYFGTGGNLRLGKANHGIANLVSCWGCYGFMVKHSMLPEILDHIRTMYAPIDDMLQDKYKDFNAYALVQPSIHPHGAETSTIWDGK
jgi:GR25 family glycosyltransferase involved in LPS biosynthesis